MIRLRLLLLLLATCLFHRRLLAEKIKEADASILEQRREDRDEADKEKDADAVEIGYFGQRGAGTGQDSSHGEDGGDANSYACRRRVAGQPERDPRQDNDET